MLTDGIKLTEGSDIVNAVVDSGTSFPSSPNVGELFYRTDQLSMSVYDGTAWVQIGLTSSMLNGQPGSYYLNLDNHTGVLSISKGGTAATSAAGARTSLGLVIGTDVQGYDADLASIAGLSGTSGFLKKTAANTWSLDTAGYLPTTGGTIVGNLNMTGHVIPTADITYDLGSPTNMWRDLYVGPGSIYMNGKKILEDVSDTIVFSTDADQNLRIATSGTGNLELQAASTGSVMIKGAMTITSGKRVLDSAGVQVEFGDDIMMNGNKITSLGAPTNVGDAATKAYVDSIGAASTNAASLTSGVLADARVQQSNVTQHQAALTIAETQITDGSLLARNAGNETITGTWSFNNAVSVGTPSSSSHAATKSYVDSIASGVTPQLAVRVATTGNITLGGTQTIDGVALVAGNRILVKDQSAPVLNGVYVVAAGSWARSTDFDGAPTNEVATGDLVFVSEGTVNANTSFVLVTPDPITVDTTALVFSVFSRAGDLNAGNGLTRTGQQIDVVGTAGRIVASADSIDLATTGTAGTYTSVTTDAYGRVTAGSTPATTLTGDVTGSGTSSIATTLASVGTAGTYKSVTTDAKGRVTAGTNPTTLVGFGITDAQPLSDNLTALAAIATTGIQVRSGSGTYASRSIAVSGTGLSITNADGVGGNPTITISSATANTPSTLVVRDGSGNFAAGTITAALTGIASGNLALAGGTMTGTIFTGIAESLRINHSTGYIAAYNTAGSTRTGYLQFNSGSNVLLSSEQTNALVLTTAGGSLTIATGGAATFTSTVTATNHIGPGTGLTGTAASLTAGSANAIGGYGVSTSQAVNTIPVRDSNGYTFFNYINSNTANNENPVINQFITTNGTDNFYRKAGIGHAATALGPSITALNNIATINGFSPTNNAIRLTPNLHLNSNAGNAVIINWDNGGSGANQQLRVGNGSASDLFSVLANGTVQAHAGYMTVGAYGGAAKQVGDIVARRSATTGVIYFGENAASYLYNDGAGSYEFGAAGRLKFAPNATWGATLFVGGDGVNGISRSNSVATMTTTDGNLHLDSGTSKAMYLNYYSGTGGIIFGGGSNNQVGSMNASGVMTMAQFNGPLNGNAASASVVAHYPGRTDSTSYPVGWFAGGTSPAYSCSAVTITSSTGTLTASALSASIVVAQSTQNTGFAGSSSGLQPTGSTGAGISFHRPGAYGLNMGLDSDNVFRIGGWSASANRLQMDMSGNLTMAGDITAFSDARLKKDIETIDHALEKVESMRGVMFTRIEDDARGTGVIAQEVQEVLPEVVRENGDGTLSVAYGNMMGLMIEAMKELSEKVKVLEAKLEKYEA